MQAPGGVVEGIGCLAPGGTGVCIGGGESVVLVILFLVSRLFLLLACHLRQNFRRLPRICTNLWSRHSYCPCSTSEVYV